LTDWSVKGSVRLLLELSMECESLSRAEALSAARALGARPKVVAEDRGVLVIDASGDARELADRLGLCHYVSEWLASGDRADLERMAEEAEVPGPIRVRSTKVGDTDVDLASATRRVGAIIGKSRGVDLMSPRSDLRIVFSKDVHLGRVISAIDRSAFERRKNRYMPFVYPASLHPKFARALVNLACVKDSCKLLDPFCGTGAIVAEAAEIRLEAIGTDISAKMIAGARTNLRHLGLSAELRRCDVGDITSTVGEVAGIATDPPYGKSTSTDGEGIPDLYRRALRSFSEVLRKSSRVAIVVPDLRLVRAVPGFTLAETHSLWVHRSLTRHFCVLERD